MQKRTYLRMTHKVDIYKKVYSVDETGQRVANWEEVVRKQPCYATPTGATSLVRIQPTMEGIDYFTISFPYDAPIDYDCRLYNLVSAAREESFYYAPLQVIKFNWYPSYTGKISYKEVTAKTVIESDQG